MNLISIAATLLAFSLAQAEAVIAHAAPPEYGASKFRKSCETSNTTSPGELIKAIRSASHLDHLGEKPASCRQLYAWLSSQSILELGIDGSGRPRIQDLDAIADQTQLKSLGLKEFTIDSIGALAVVSGLEILSIQQSAVADLAPISFLINLRELEITGPRIAELTHLLSLPKLTHLTLNNNAIEDAAGLSSIGTLEHLNLRSNPFRDLSFINRLPHLTYLNVGWSRVKDLAPLLGSQNLKKVDLDRVDFDQAQFDQIKRQMPNTQFYGMSETECCEAQGSNPFPLCNPEKGGHLCW